MPDITNPTAVKFCNEKVRVLADVLSQAYFTSKAIIAEWNAVGMATLIPNTLDPVIDGSAADGRNPITGAKATNVITRAIEFVADYEALSNAKLTTVVAVKVNGESRF